jgi:hypothetical protein
MVPTAKPRSAPAHALASGREIHSRSEDRKLPLQVAADVPAEDLSRAKPDCDPDQVSVDLFSRQLVRPPAQERHRRLRSDWKGKPLRTHDRIPWELAHISMMLVQNLDHLVRDNLVEIIAKLVGEGSWTRICRLIEGGILAHWSPVFGENHEEVWAKLTWLNLLIENIAWAGN